MKAKKTCLIENRDAKNTQTRGSAANPRKVGPFTRNRAGLLREYVQKQKWAVSWIGADHIMEVNLAIFPVHTWPANVWEVNQCAV